jgi:hypothetical protein
MTHEKLRALLGPVQAGTTHKLAFPDGESLGMNLLEYFTASALSGILANRAETINPDVARKLAIEFAAHALAELRKATGCPN